MSENAKRNCGPSRGAGWRAAALRPAGAWPALAGGVLGLAVGVLVQSLRVDSVRWLVCLLGVLLAGVLIGRAVASAACRPVTAQVRKAQERLAGQSAEIACYADLLDVGDFALVALRPDGLIIGWSPAAVRLYGYAVDEVVGKSLTVLNSAAALNFVRAAGEFTPGMSTSFESVHVRRDGTALQVQVTLTRPTGQADKVVAIIRDVTADHARDEESHQESKLESLGRLAAGLAHEINSPIQFVGDNARFLEEAYQELIRVVEVYRGLIDTSSPMSWMERQERVREAEAGIDFDFLQKEIPSAVAQTLEGVDRVSTIVRAMKTFSHPGHKEQVPADLNEALAATVTVTRHQISEVADLSLDLSPLPPVRCNIADLNQVFLNLIINAADAIEETGQRGLITVATDLDGDDVVIRISDTGGGVPEEIRSKIFDPFFTTKEVGRGSGQGLPLVRGVVQEGHGGSVTVDSVVGQRTTFTVRIPVDGLRQHDATDRRFDASAA